ncbi:N-methyl-L-tryptophan oxidase [Streptomyces sp. Li-HN-5-11]|uniref:N-methyl-L-tryptophan oxidase n=1 Tax=Streptomyces sp. Li-HN-5-11 TaxID=3075432 RepID=UPI0028B146DF|nr:N-methyl-L-tryptophan oxidase [Streptomyces sp. Li-HN-5-11]WNM32784.1 N-methyl-L-tryptophan oxidase [Streptomyces sp. Li-HN-5-11]
MSAARKRVAVVGVGTMGSQAAWRLAARGAEVVGYDRYAPGHDRGAAGGETRIFRSAHFEDSRYVPLLQHADALWGQLQQETGGRELRRLTGCLLMGSTEEQQMATVLESIAEHGLDHEVLDAETLAKRFPQYRLEDGDAVVLDRRAGVIRPELTVQSAARRAEQLGAVIHRYTTVREIVPVANGVEIRTDTGSERFDAAVVTPGPWVGDLLPDLPWEVEIRRLISAWFVSTTDAWFGEERPAFIRTSPTHCYGLPSPDGVSVKLGLSQALHKPAGDPNQLDRTVQPEELEIFSELIGRYLPDLHPDPTRLSVYMEGYTKSSRPLVGPLPGAGNENVILLAGFSGHGFKLSPAYGDIAADLALNGSSPQPIDFISTADRTAA